MNEPMTFTREDGVAGMPSEITNEPVGPMVGIAAIALNMALKYHDINTVQDGLLYQQYKLEGKNMHGLHMDMVFHTAIQIEEHLVAANRRVAKMLVLAALDEQPSGDGALTHCDRCKGPIPEDDADHCIIARPEADCSEIVCAKCRAADPVSS